MLIKHIYSGLSISAIVKILQNKIHFCSNEALFEFEAQQLKGSIKKGWILLKFFSFLLTWNKKSYAN